MDESTVRLQRQLAGEHEQLNDNLEVLERKARELTDWRAQFEKRPLLLLGLAFGGGLIASGLVGRRRISPARDFADGRSMSTAMPRPSAPVNGNWQQVRNTLSAVASGVAAELLQELVPGFKEHYDRVKDHVVHAIHASAGPARPNRPATEPGSDGRAYNAPDTA
jgi:hypothetical protein